MDIKKTSTVDLERQLYQHDCHLSPDSGCPCGEIILELRDRMNQRITHEKKMFDYVTKHVINLE